MKAFLPVLCFGALFRRCRDQVACVYSSNKKPCRRALTEAKAANTATSPVAPAAGTAPSDGGGGRVGEMTSASLSTSDHRAGQPGLGGPAAFSGYGGAGVGGGTAARGFFPHPLFGGGGNRNGWAVASNTIALMEDLSGGRGSRSSSGGGGDGGGMFWGPPYAGSGPGGAGMAVGPSVLAGVDGAGAAKMLHRGIAAAFRAVRHRA